VELDMEAEADMEAEMDMEVEEDMEAEAEAVTTIVGSYGTSAGSYLVATHSKSAHM